MAYKNKEKQKEYNRKYYLAYKELSYSKKWHLKHPNYNKKYYSEHKKEYKRYYLAHKEEEIEHGKKWYQKHKKEQKECHKKWRKKNPERAREIRRKHYYKRKRNLGYIPINKHFKDSVFHHLDKDIGIYIPKWLHRSIWHNLFTGQGMDKINTEAIHWWIIHQCKNLGEERKNEYP